MAGVIDDHEQIDHDSHIYHIVYQDGNEQVKLSSSPFSLFDRISDVWIKRHSGPSCLTKTWNLLAGFRLPTRRLQDKLPP